MLASPSQQRDRGELLPRFGPPAGSAAASNSECGDGQHALGCHDDVDVNVVLGRGHRFGYQAIQHITGVGRAMAASASLETSVPTRSRKSLAAAPDLLRIQGVIATLGRVLVMVISIRVFVEAGR
jgi:hypothetical protein